jgi:simple sugar transport system ATP-binding protein
MAASLPAAGRTPAALSREDEMSIPLLETRDVVKRYGGVHALKGVSLRIEAGTVHGLLGENGAGKSTLVKIVAGLVQPTEGEILLDGTRITAPDVRAMEEYGVFLVSQEPMIVGGLSVADNLMLGRWPTGRMGIDDRRMHAMAAEFLAGTGLDSRQPAVSLNAVDRRKLNILRALHSGGRLIILDEPTTALTLADRSQLFAFMNRLKTQGVTFLFISHYNEEILEICDAVSVLRDGELAAGNLPVSTLEAAGLSELVLGRGLALFHRAPAPPVDSGRAWKLTNVRGTGLSMDSLTIAPGEIVGFAGLPGSGARELGRALFGLLPGYTGRIGQGEDARPLPAHPAAALAAGIAFLSEDRLKDGVVAIQSIHENICLSSLGRVSRSGWISGVREAALVRHFFGALDIKASGPATRVGALSGGNQQKVCLSRLLATEPRLLILNEPTRGIDVGVKEEVHRLIDELTRSGVSVIVVSSDLDEMLRLVDRVVLFAGGRVVADRRAGELTKDEVLATAFTSQPAGTPASALTEERIDA